jgi:hypothetical protein
MNSNLSCMHSDLKYDKQNISTQTERVFTHVRCASTVQIFEWNLQGDLANKVLRCSDFTLHMQQSGAAISCRPCGTDT